ncbi:cytochrome P450 CYP736A12-like [Pistacia vera]|uniref:cytochrome P450 CYP736A12-like n=1 Tax=Pistacia vera TaxID=55513 RepID=UPI0012636D48|nr:cytochrome P450 CYP736A12-like [Pistacia vera]
MSWTWTSLALVALVFFLQAFPWKKDSKTKRLPPGPRGFPIFGSLHLLGKFPHKDFHKLAKKYGSIMFLRLGSIPTIVVSSPHAAEQFLKTQDLVFASRPPVEAAKHIGYRQKNLSFSPYGSYWRAMRKICTLELLSSAKISSFRAMRKEELYL